MEIYMLNSDSLDNDAFWSLKYILVLQLSLISEQNTKYLYLYFFSI